MPKDEDHRRTPRRAGVVLLLTVLLALTGGPNARAARWLTGPELRKQWVRVVGLGWTDMPLRRGVEEFSRQNQVAVLLDRRVDPGQEVTLSVSRVPLNEVFQRIAQHLGLGVCLVESVVYFGPPEITAKLRTVVALREEEVRQLPAAMSERYLRRRTLAWEDFTTPRGLLDRLSEEAGIPIVGTERVPHDLWAAADLPPLTFVERLSLVAGQYDLTFRIAPGGTSVELVPVPAKVVLIRSYPGGRDPQALAQRWREELPGRQIEVRGDRVFVAATVEEHDRIDPDRVVPRPLPHEKPGKMIIEKYTVKNIKLSQVLHTLGERFRLDIRVDTRGLAAAGISLDQLVTINVENATVGEFLNQLLPQHGLRFRQRGNVIEIFPAK